MIEPFTKEAWKKLSGKERWDVIVAMRGPDTRNEGALKWFVTGPLRAKMWPILKADGGSALVNKDLNLIVVPTGTIGPQEMIGNLLLPPNFALFNLDHFIQHAREAAGILGVPILYVPRQAWLKGMVANGPETTCQIWLDALPESPGKDELARHAKALKGGLM